MRRGFEKLYPRPAGELGPVLVEVSVEGITASLQIEAGGTLWLRVLEGDVELFDRVGSAPSIVGATRPGGPFFLAGSFERWPASVRSVRVSGAEGEWEAATAEHGWLCLIPSNTRGPVSVLGLDGEGKTRETFEQPPLSDVGAMGPTFYGPPVF